MSVSIPFPVIVLIIVALILILWCLIFIYLVMPRVHRALQRNFERKKEEVDSTNS